LRKPDAGDGRDCRRAGRPVSRRSSQRRTTFLPPFVNLACVYVSL
jgi:hypothetical protein